jgi:glycosyltransferase involved in cell wall biosynthesis
VSAIAGKLEGVQHRRAVGWAKPLDPAAAKVRLAILLDGNPVAEVVADQPRGDLARKFGGDGAWSFAHDISHFLVPGQARHLLRVVAVAAQVELPGSPFAFTPPADGRAERIEGDELVGWAHGPSFAPARLLLQQGGRVLLAWRCAEHRADLARKGVGTGWHGFRLKLLHFVPETALPDLSLRIEDTEVELPMPPWPRARSVIEGLPSEPPAGALPDAAAARLAVLAGLDPGADGPAAPIAFSALQHALNRLTRLEQLLAEQADHAAIMAARHAGVAPPAPLPAPLAAAPPTAPAVAALLALIGEAGLAPAELSARLGRDLLPAWLDAPPAGRHAFNAALLRHAGPELLGIAMRVFRTHDTLEVPALAQARQLLIQPEPPALAVVRHQRLIASWHAARTTPPPLPAPALLARRGGGRALYTLWRSVPYDTNGYAMRSHYLLRALRARGVDVIGVTRLGYPWDAEKRLAPGAQAETVDGVPYWHLGGREANRSVMPIDAYAEDCAARLAQVAVATGADVIHSASNWMAALPALGAARLIGLPFCYEMRGLWEVTRASNLPGYRRTDHYDLFRRMETHVAGHADLLFTITAGVREAMAARGVDVARARLLPNGVEVARFGPQPRDAALAAALGIAGDEMVFGYLGTFAEYEGLPELVRAAAALHRRGLRFRLLLVGDGPALAAVQAVLAAEQLGDRVLLLGRVPFTEVPRHYSLVDVAVFPRSPVEITEMVSPLKPFEAMAMGKPVVGSDVRALAEIIRHGETGWLFAKGDGAALAATLAALVAAPDAVRRAGEAARRFVAAHHDWSVIAGRLAAGWEDLRRGTVHGG